ncbi:energy-coupling factor transporter ATPase [bacterium D16-51]|nr:energy-coupling factor transporter ATPase [bacterium D16-59]RKI58991.1 energy-coupling factor transporter ATPase [bacterium D16-51]
MGIKNKIIKSENLAHEYARRDESGDVTGIVRALDGIDVQIEAGSFVAVLGANGSGKSTFAKHLNGLLFPTEGTLYIDGMDTADSENTLAVRQTAGMVFQNPDNQIIANIVEEDVGFGPENMGVPTDKILKRVEECLKETGMYSYRRHSPNHLSGGQKQRVAVAGVLAMRPKCIILDEATAMLDPAGRKNVLDTIVRLNKKEHITVILITHYMEEVTLADYVYVMKQGKVAYSGTPGEVFQNVGMLRECRLEAPQITQIAQGLQKAGIPLTQGVFTIEGLAKELLELAKKR